jgi:hypothetical protein
VRFEVGSVGAASPHGSQVVALATRDLRVIDAEESRLEALMLSEVHTDLVGIEQPIEGAPDLTAEELLGALRTRQAADGGNGTKGSGDVGVMLVGEVMGVDLTRMRSLKQERKVLDRLLGGGILEDAARIVEHYLRGVLADLRGLALLFEPNQAHLLIGVGLVEAVAGRAAAVSSDHTGEPLVLLLEAVEDGAARHDLDVVLVGSHAQVRGARQRLLCGQAIGDKDLRGLKTEFHASLPC